jgi:hypothetical protein
MAMPEAKKIMQRKTTKKVPVFRKRLFLKSIIITSFDNEWNVRLWILKVIYVDVDMILL